MIKRVRSVKRSDVTKPVISVVVSNVTVISSWWCSGLNYPCWLQWTQNTDNQETNENAILLGTRTLQFLLFLQVPRFTSSPSLCTSVSVNLSIRDKASVSLRDTFCQCLFAFLAHLHASSHGRLIKQAIWKEALWDTEQLWIWM